MKIYFHNTNLEVLFVKNPLNYNTIRGYDNFFLGEFVKIRVLLDGHRIYRNAIVRIIGFTTSGKIICEKMGYNTKFRFEISVEKIKKLK